MVTINFILLFNVLAPSIRHVQWSRLPRISIEVFQVTIIEDTFVDFGIDWIKYKSGVVFLFQVVHHMQSGLRMSLLRISKVRRK